MADSSSSLVRILTVNNFGDKVGRKWLALLRDSLKLDGVRAETVDRAECSAGRFREYDGVVLSGSQAMASQERTIQIFASEIDAIRESSTATLGICFGHQLLCHAFGSKVVRASKPTERYVETEVLVDDPVFAGLPQTLSVFEAHHEVVDSVPRGFRLLARSPTCAVGAVKREKLPVYGVQFHPERNSSRNPDGARIIANFVECLS